MVDSSRSANSTFSTAAYDGDLSTSWGTSGNEPSRATITLDLGGSQQLTGVKWAFIAATGADLFTVQTSINGETWTDVTTSSNRMPETWEGVSTNEQARYVRFVFENPNVGPVLGNLAEVEIWGQGDVATREPDASTVAGTPTPMTTPTATPSVELTVVLTREPTVLPTLLPTVIPTVIPTLPLIPTEAPTPSPTLSPAPDATVAPAFDPVIAYVADTGGDGAFLRTTPDGGGEVLATLTDGTELVVTGRTNGEWTPVDVQGTAGFVYTLFVSTTAPQPTLVARDAGITPTVIAEEGNLQLLPTQELLEPTPAPQIVTREQVVPVAGDAGVSSAQPDVPQSGEAGTILNAGGSDGMRTVFTFNIDGVGAGTVVNARLVLTGAGEVAGPGGDLLVGPGIGFDEYSVTQSELANAGLGGAGTVDYVQPGIETSVDVTGIVVSDGTISFVISGTPDQVVGFTSRESGIPAYLVLTIEETVP